MAIFCPGTILATSIDMYPYVYSTYHNYTVISILVIVISSQQVGTLANSVPDVTEDMYALQGFKSTPSETVRAALAAGTNVACSPGAYELQPSGYQAYCKTLNPRAFEFVDHFLSVFAGSQSLLTGKNCCWEGGTSPL